jgi:hypothetical protein
MSNVKNTPVGEAWGRSPKWFPIEQDLRYEFVNHNRTSGFGTGRTLEMSSKEIRFTTHDRFKLGERVRLRVHWPTMLNDRCLMQLVIVGRVMRSGPGTAAVEIDRYEFRTRRVALPAESGALGRAEAAPANGFIPSTPQYAHRQTPGESC